MLKKALAKAAAATLAAAGIFIAPGLVAGTTALQLSACDVSASDITVTLPASTVVGANTAYTGTATVTSGVAGHPVGTVTVRYEVFTPGTGYAAPSSPANPVIGGPTASNSVSYTLPSSTLSNRTYRIRATYVGQNLGSNADCSTVTANSAYQYISKLKYDTTTTKNSNTQVTVTPSGQRDSANAPAGLPTGTVDFVYVNFNNGSRKCDTKNLTGTVNSSTGVASVSPSPANDCVFSSATYSGDTNYNTSSTP